MSKFFRTVFTNGPDKNAPQVDQQKLYSILTNICNEEVGKILNNLNKNKSISPNKIHPGMMKEIGYEIHK